MIIRGTPRQRVAPTRGNYFVNVSRADNRIIGCRPMHQFGLGDCMAIQLSAFVDPTTRQLVLFKREGGKYDGRYMIQSGKMEERDLLPSNIGRVMPKTAIARATVREGAEELRIPPVLLARMLGRSRSQLLEPFDVDRSADRGYWQRFYMAVVVVTPQEIAGFDITGESKMSKVRLVSIDTDPTKGGTRSARPVDVYLFSNLQQRFPV